MGKWESGRGIVSDLMADLLGDALADIEQVNPFTRLIDLADAIEFVTRGLLKVEINPECEYDGDYTLALLRDKDFKTINNRGQIHKDGKNINDPA